MALVKCVDCKNEISESAKACPHCARPIVVKRKEYGCLSVIFLGGLLFIVGLILVGIFSNAPTSKITVQKTVDFTELKSGVDGLIKSGFIQKLDLESNEVFVSKILWLRTTLDQKKMIGSLLARYCGYVKSTNLNWVVIRDHKSGRRLAKWSESFGMTVDD